VPATLEELKERAKPWIEPIPGGAPAGAAAKLDPAYQALANEVGKIDMPAGGAVDWKNVVEMAGGILKTKTKDLLITGYLAHALHRTKQLDGLLTGITLVTEMIEVFWEGLFPELKRIRGRGNALQWYLDKTDAFLPADAPAAELERIQNLDLAAKRLAQVVRDRFADAAPAMGPLLEKMERMRLTLEASAPPPPSEPAQQTAEATPGQTSGQPSAPPATTTSAPSAAAMPATAGEMGGAADATQFLQNVGSSLINAAGTLRRADLTDPFAYRILRVGLWLHIASPPPATGGKTSVPVPPEGLRNQLNAIFGNQKWQALIEEAESALFTCRFALDLHRMTHQALAGLGSGYDRARDAVAIEVRSLLSRMPQLPTLSFSDGTPFADPQTKAWIEEIAPKGGGGAKRAAEGAADEASQAKMDEARKLLGASQVAEALALLQSVVTSAPPGRRRFLARLELARLCSGGGLMPVAQAVYEELEKEAALHGLDEWEPELVSECLKGLIACTRALSKDPRGASKDFTPQYKRLCRLDPAAAHEVWP
jgi:type VI secretion system protein VasJ